MKNNKGFTLVELLAMMVVLTILMGVTIPNITGILSNNRLNILKQDAKSMVEKAKVKVAKNNITKPNARACLVFSLDYLNDNGDFEKGPNGGVYDQYESFVIVTQDTNNEYQYYIRLMEEVEDSEYVGLDMENIKNVNTLNDDTIIEMTKLGLTENNQADNLNKLKTNERISSICTTITNYYVVNKHYCEKYNGRFFDNNGNIVSEEQYNSVCS